MLDKTVFVGYFSLIAIKKPHSKLFCHQHLHMKAKVLHSTCLVGTRCSHTVFVRDCQETGTQHVEKKASIYASIRIKGANVKQSRDKTIILFKLFSESHISVIFYIRKDVHAFSEDHQVILSKPRCIPGNMRKLRQKLRNKGRSNILKFLFTSWSSDDNLVRQDAIFSVHRIAYSGTKS